MFKLLEKRWLSIVITLVLAAIIFYLSSLSSPPAPKVIDLSTAYHITLFFLFSFFLFFSLKGKGKIKLKHLLIALLISVLYAGLDEMHQLFVPYRTCSIADFLSDTSGILFSLLLLSLVYLRKSKKKAKKKQML